MLEALAEHDPEARREMSNLIRQQYEQRNHDRFFLTADPSKVELAGGARSARGAFGTGGGRVRHPREPDQDD